MQSPLAGPLIARWCISFAGIALLAGLVWFFAPLLPGFEDSPPRLAVIIALLLSVPWAALERPATVAELGQLLGDRFGLEPGHALADAAALVEQLAERGLVVLSR